MRKLTFLLACLMMIGVGLVNAQSRTVSGKVFSAEDGEPIIGATVMVKGTTVGTITGVDGDFTVSVPANANTLIVSFIGMKTVEVEAKNGLTVRLVSDSKALDEVLVVAYGTAKKESFTGSAEIIKPERLERRTASNVTKALDGAVAGLQTTSGSGQPGAGAAVVIRGFGSIKASSNPLYVVDGVPYDGNINAISQSDIETITVLKDASAGALYGARGANGVIVITTKKGKDGKVAVNLKANWGVSSRAIPRYELLDEKGYLETVFQSYKNSQITNNALLPEQAGVAALEAMANGSTRMLGVNQQYNPFNYPIQQLIDPTTGKVRSDATLRYKYDWMDEVTAVNPLRQDYNISLSGSENKVKYMFSLGYLNEEGLLRTTNFERFSGRTSVDVDVKDWFKMGLSSNFSSTSSNTSQTSTSAFSNVFYTAQLMAPIFPVYELDDDANVILDATGKPKFDYGKNRPSGASENFNTVATLFDDKYGSSTDNISARTYLNLGDLKTGPLQGLKLSLNLAFDYVGSQGFTYYNPYFGNAATTSGMISKANGRTFSYTSNQLLSYARKFGVHNIDVLAGHEFYKYRYDYLNASKTGFPFGGLYELDAATTITEAGSYQNNYSVDSYLFRANYDYNDRYYLSGSYRRDASSRFHKDYRWGNFWSVGGNWRISQEDFMAGVEWVDNLSLKASYGVQGNDAVGTLYAWQAFYDLGWPNASMSGAMVSSIENTNLKWEENGNFNAGVEAKLFDRLTASIEWYQRTTKDMLLDYPMASSLGFDSYLRNIGSMRNRGLEFTIGGDVVKTKDFSWNLTVIGSTIKNKVLKLADKPEIITGSYIIKEGEEINSFWVTKAAGVDPASGNQLYWVWDVDAEGVKSEPYVSDNVDKATASKQIMGSRIPNLYGSLNNEFKYKGFDLSVMTTYSMGGKILDGVYRTFMYGNYVGQAKHVNVSRAWKNAGDITDVPKVEIGKAYPTTDNDLIDASYFAIKNITLGYTLPSKLAKKIDLTSVRLTATADNLAVFTHLKGMDPQFNFSGGTSYVYTPTRTFSVGVDVKF